MTATAHDNLTGKILIAMPAMTDPRFARSVILICAHGEDGAMGLVLNRPLPDLGFADLLRQLQITGSAMRDIPVHFGGPVEPGRGFVLHDARPGDNRADQLAVGHGLTVTSTRDILEDLAHGTGPARAVLALGYAGWGPGQLESEILDNGWLSGEADDALIFGGADEAKWTAALRGQGIEPSMLSGAFGRA